jgi:hypothetical protein
MLKAIYKQYVKIRMNSREGIIAMKRWKLLFTIALLCLSFAAALASCGGGGGGGGGGGVPSGSLAGTWFGSLEDDVGDLHTLQVTVNANNTVTGELVDGSATGVTHTVAAVSGQAQIFGLTGSDGTSGGFYVDGSFTHAVFADDAWNFAVLQKGATSLPTYVTSDAVGTWSGFEVILNTNFDLVETFNSNVIVAQNNSFSGSNKYNTISGTFSQWDLPYGGFFGNLTSPPNWFTVVYLSPDKHFAGGYSCDYSGFYPEDCTFQAWNK